MVSRGFSKVRKVFALSLYYGYLIVLLRCFDRRRHDEKCQSHTNGQAESADGSYDGSVRSPANGYDTSLNDVWWKENYNMILFVKVVWEDCKI